MEGRKRKQSSTSNGASTVRRLPNRKKKSDAPILNKRGMPVRTRKKNPLFFSDDVYLTSNVNRQDGTKSGKNNNNPINNLKSSPIVSRSGKKSSFNDGGKHEDKAIVGINNSIVGGSRSKRVIKKKTVNIIPSTTAARRNVRSRVSRVQRRNVGKVTSPVLVGKKKQQKLNKKYGKSEEQDDTKDGEEMETESKDSESSGVDESSREEMFTVGSGSMLAAAAGVPLISVGSSSGSSSSSSSCGDNRKKSAVRRKSKIKQEGTTTTEGDKKPPALSSVEVWQRDEAEDTGKRLRNLLKLPKAFNWVCCEFYYSVIDKVIFDYYQNDFMICLRQKFPFIRNFLLTRTEWSMIRRVLGKPRRCSALFFKQEIADLNRKRAIVRSLQKGDLRKLRSLRDIPLKLPLLPQDTTRVTARFYRNRMFQQQDGVHIGCISNIDRSNNLYKLVFDNPNLHKEYVRDLDVLYSSQLNHVSRNTMIRSVLRKSKNPKNQRACKLVNDFKRRVKNKTMRHAMIKKKLRTLTAINKHNSQNNSNSNNNNNNSNNNIINNNNNNNNNNNSSDNNGSVDKAANVKFRMASEENIAALSSNSSINNAAESMPSLTTALLPSVFKHVLNSVDSSESSLSSYHILRHNNKIKEYSGEIVNSSGCSDSRPPTGGDQPVDIYDLVLLIAQLKKIVEHKQLEVDKLSRMNTEIELANLYEKPLNEEFRSKYAANIVVLELLNRDLLATINKIKERFVRYGSAETISPTYIERESMNTATELLAKNNVVISDDNVVHMLIKDKPLLMIVRELTSLMVLMKSLASKNPKHNSSLLEILNTKMAKIKNTLAGQNKALFEHCVETHIRQLQSVLMGTAHLNSYTPSKYIADSSHNKDIENNDESTNSSIYDNDNGRHNNDNNNDSESNSNYNNDNDSNSDDDDDGNNDGDESSKSNNEPKMNNDNDGSNINDDSNVDNCSNNDDKMNNSNDNDVNSVQEEKTEMILIVEQNETGCNLVTTAESDVEEINDCAEKGDQK